MPSCRVCHYPIDKTKEEGVDWIQPSKGWYFHKDCYETLKAAPATDDDWVEMIYDFLARDLKVKYEYHMCQAQIENFWKKKRLIPKVSTLLSNIFMRLKVTHGIKDMVVLVQYHMYLMMLKRIGLHKSVKSVVL